MAILPAAIRKPIIALASLERLPALTDTLCVTVIGAAIFLLLNNLVKMGLTLDEYVDFGIATDIARDWRAVLGNTTDGSQGRLNHILAALSMRLGSVSYLSFKMPFVLVGLLGSIYLFWVLHERYSFHTALIGVAFFISNSYVLGSFRTAATAGDALVCVLVIPFMFSLVGWLEKRDFPSCAICGLITGSLIGAKWNCVVLVPLSLLFYVLQPSNGRKFTACLQDLICYTALVAFGAALTSPTLLLGVDFIAKVLGIDFKLDSGVQNVMAEFGQPSPWYFLSTVILAKYGLPFILIFFIAIVWRLYAAVLKRCGDLPSAISLAVVAVSTLFALRRFQNAYYYIITMGPAIVIVCSFVESCRRWGENSQRWITAACAILLSIQIGKAYGVAPDFLQAGREWGDGFQGEFAGPAINHCQGGPLALLKMSKYAQQGRDPDVYTFNHCYVVLKLDLAMTPAAGAINLKRFPESGLPQDRPYFVAIPHRYYYATENRGSLSVQLQRAVRATENCQALPNDMLSYSLFYCAAKPST